MKDFDPRTEARLASDGAGSAQDDFAPLEDRIMFDGAAAAEAMDAASDQVDAQDTAAEAERAAAEAEAAETLAAAALDMPDETGAAIYFVDAGVGDAEALISAIPDGAEVVLLEADRDGVSQIADVLEGRSGVEAVHILSHGSAGDMHLGSGVLNAASIAGEHASALASIGAALADGADILIYGCDFGQDGAVLEALAAVTGADVAASDDATGAAALGGDWDLEARSGDIEAVALSATSFGGLLAAPEVTVVTAALSGSEDTPLVINGVSVADSDGGPLDVTVTASNGIVTLAQTTNLTVAGDGTGNVTLSGAIADINAALSGMTYEGNANFNGADTVSVAADDSTTQVSEDITISLAGVNDAPTMTPVNGTAAEGGSVVLTNTEFGLADPDLDALLNTNPQLAKQIVFKLDASNLPAEGQLFLNATPLIAGSTFSLQNLLDGDITYTHDGSDVTAGDTDDFSVTFNDGGGSGDVGPVQVTLDLTPVNQAPVIEGNPTVFEGQGTEEQFQAPGTTTTAADVGAALTITDRDDLASTSTITITNVNNAGEGTLFWDANGDGLLDAGEELTGGETFAADELTAGRLLFAHDGSEPDGINPSFDIEVTDAGGGAGIGNALSSGAQTIEIAVTPNNDNPVLAVNTALTVNSGTTEVITVGNLQSTDVDSAAENIVFTVTSIPTKGELRINGEILGVGGSFTQADLDAGLVDYRSTASVTDGETDTFNFEVRDSTLRAFNNAGIEGAVRDPDGTITEHTFVINLDGDLFGGTAPGTADPGRSGNVVIDSTVNTGILVTEGDGVSGGSDTVVLDATDLQYVLETDDGLGGTTTIAADSTVFRITALPGNGTLFLSGTALALFDSFTQDDIDNGRVSFVHDGSENHQDSFGFSVSAGTAAEFADTFNLLATPTNDAPTVETNDLPLIAEGATQRVTVAEIVLTDVDANDEAGEGGGVNDPFGEAVVDNLWFRLTDLPDNGQVERFDGANWVAVTTDDLMPADLLSAAADGGTSGLRYVHDGSENFTDSFDVIVRDDLAAPANVFATLSEATEGAAAAGNISASDTVNVTMAPQNDAPIAPQLPADADTTITDANAVNQTTANQVLNMEEGTTEVITSAFLKAVDADNTDQETIQFRITTAPVNGVLTLNGNLIGVGSTFTQADIDSGDLSYTHDGSENFTDQFNFIVSDSVSDHVFSDAIGAGSGISTFEILIDGGRNDPPEVVTDGNDTIDVFGTFTHNFGNDIRLVDIDIDDGVVDAGRGETDFLQVTVSLKDNTNTLVDLSVTGGITLGSTVGLTQTDGNDDNGDLVFQGSYDDVQAALTNLQIELPNTDANARFTLEVSVDDRLRDGTGALTAGANGDDNGVVNADGTPIDATNNVDTLEITLQASDDNDDPTITSPGDQVVNEDTAFNIAGLSIDDVDAFDSDLTVTLAVNNGSLSVTGNAIFANPATLVLTGTVAELNAQLANLSYISDSNFHSRDGVNGNTDDDTLTITVNDGGANGSGGGGDVTTTLDIGVNPVNDRPSVNVPGTQVLDSGLSLTLSGADAPTVADTRDYNNTPVNDNMRVTVFVDAGEGTLTGSGNSLAGLVDTNADPHTLVLEGTRDDLNRELDGLVFTPTDPNTDREVTITVRVNDLANGGTALAGGIGGNQTASDTIVVQISNVNEPPAVNNLLDAAVDEDSSVTFSTGNGNAFTISDSDDFGAAMEATLSVNDGILTVAAGSGATVTNDGTGTVTINGTETQINAALDGLTYTPTGDFHTSGVGGDTLTVSINDLGNTGGGGAQTTVDTAEITVNPINDRPVASGGPVNVASSEDQSGAGTVLATLLAGNYSDATDDQTASGGGTTETALSFVAIVGSTNYDASQGTWQVADGVGGFIDIPVAGLDDTNALIIDASREIRFVPAADFHGTPGTLDVRLADGDAIDAITESANAADLQDLSTEGGTSQTGRWSAGTVTIQTSVTAENDPPTGTDATLASVLEDDADPVGARVDALFGPGYDDSTDDQTAATGGGDSSTAFGGIAVIGSAADAATEGSWQFSIDGGANWTSIPQGADDDSTAILLPANAELRFLPVADYNGTPGDLSVRLADTPQVFSASTDISGVVGDDPTRSTDIWSDPVALDTSITPVNDAPSALASQNFNVGEDTGTQTVVSFMDTIEEGGGPDEDGQTVSFTIDNITDGTIYTAAQLFSDLPNFTDNDGADNTLTFTPTDILASGETQTVTVTVGITDDGGTANGGVDTGTDQTFTITLIGANDAPTTTGIGDQANTDGEAISLDVSGSFSDVDITDTLQFSATGLPPGLTINPTTGEITGNIDFDASTGGPYAVTITATDIDDDGAPTGTSVDANFTWTVTNPVPTALDDVDTTDEDTPITRDAANGVIVPNDTDGAPDGDTLLVDQVDGVPGGVSTPVAGTTGGLFTIEPDGSYTFDPNGEFDDLSPGDTRVTEVTYRITDGEGGTDTATLSVTVTGVNDPPVADDDSATTLEDTPVTIPVLTNDNDPDGTLDPSTVQITGTANPGDPVTVPGEGTWTVDLITGNITFTPEPNFDGTPTPITYTVDDNTGLTSNTATVTVTITPVNDAPTLNDDTASTPEDTPVTIDVLSNDTDVDGTLDPSSVQITGTANPGDPLSVPGEGTWTVDLTTGSITFTPEPDFNGAPTPITYSATDDNGTAAPPATVTVTVTPVPDAFADNFTTPEDVPIVDDVSTNDTHGNTRTYALNSNASNGTVVMNPDGTFTYTPIPDFNGNDSFTYDVTDINGDTETVTVSIVVTPVQDAFDDFETTDQDTPIDIDVNINDDFEGPNPVFTVEPGDEPANGTVVLTGTSTFTYTPAPGFTGTDTFTYTVTSGGVTETAVVTIDVDPASPSNLQGTANTAPPKDPVPERPRLVVDHIIDMTTNAAGGLHGTTSLLSGLNTDLGVVHPILLAMNGLQGIGGTAELFPSGNIFFAGIGASGPLLNAIDGFGFPSMVNQYDLFDQAFPKDAASIDAVVTREGFLLQLAIFEEGDQPLLRAEVHTPMGEAAEVQSVRLAALDETTTRMDVTLASGHEIALDLTLEAQDDGVSLASVTETDGETFSAQTQHIASAKDSETARLLNAVRGL